MLTVLVSLASLTLLAAAPDTTTYPVLNHGRRAGEMVVIRDGDSVLVRYRHIDRNRGQRSESRYRFGDDGRVLSAEARPVGLDDGVLGDAVTSFRIESGTVHWIERGMKDRIEKVERGTLYALRGGTPFDDMLVANQLLRQSQRSANVFPLGRATLEIVADTVVPTAGGPQRVRFAVIHGIQPVPNGVWLDESGSLFASDVAWFVTVRPGAERALPILRAIEVAWRNARGAEVARKAAPERPAVLAITNADVFDSERAVVRPRSTILVRGERIVAVGPSDSVQVPANAMVIDAAGKTVVPGMWDMHTHFQLASQSSLSPLQLARGITTIRDLASDIDVAVSHRDRARAGTLASPRVILAGFIEGPGLWAGPSEVLVRTEDEARAWVARYDSLGFRQIKLYNLVHPDLVPVIAAEAHARGMRLSGHVPRGLTVPAAVALGYDEINHGAFLFSTFYQDSLYTPRMRAYSLVAATVAPNVDVDSPEMSRLLETLRARGTVIDGTFNLWMRADTIGPRASQARAANAHYRRLIKRLYDHGITLVPGTDGSSYNDELESYERAGIPAAEVLKIATLVPARVMKEDRDYGSIVAGKIADLVIVNGKPAEHVAELRKVERVVLAGRVYDPQKLYDAAEARRREERLAGRPQR